MGAFFAKHGQVDEVGAVRSKTGIATGDMVLQVVLTQHSFHDISNALTCRDKRMLIVVDGEKPCCWICGLTVYMSKACPRKKVVANVQPITNIAEVAATEENPPWCLDGDEERREDNKSTLSSIAGCSITKTKPTSMAGVVQGGEAAMTTENARQENTKATTKTATKERTKTAIQKAATT